jgi:hypothetical protein
MSFSEDLRSGFALAATIAKDAGAGKARPGLAASSVEALTAMACELASLPKAQRRARVRALMSPSALPAPALTSAARNLPPLRALALLSQRLPEGHEPTDEAAAQRFLPRPGYAPDPNLLAVLQRIAARSGLTRHGQEDAWRE